MLLKILLFSILLGLTFSRYFIVGPAQVKILNVASCPEYPNQTMQFVLKGHMYNKSTQLLDGFLSIPDDLDKSTTIYLKASRIDKHKTQVNSFVINDSEACTALYKYVGDLWLNVQAQIGMEPGACPMKKGNYSVKNFVLDLTKLNVQMILEGVFKTRVIFKNQTKPIYCGDFTIELSPKSD
ncbi:hypothetical protein TcasGA2_TC031580 [Tribolium castaneum]|uniref:MD-2-related lipid-recognition domain-containing protein n=2 Tax=Tribolium castaneum TaxID=7070 RepID=A0A139WPK0_TRICA|nr:hypothetical protein TcasGA2_TC031580 [Tribolium castaneum]